MPTGRPIRKRYAYHKPSAVALNKIARLRRAFSMLEDILEEVCPKSRELSIAVTHLEDASMYAVKAVVFNDPASEADLQDKPQNPPNGACNNQDIPDHVKPCDYRGEGRAAAQNDIEKMPTLSARCPYTHGSLGFREWTAGYNERMQEARERKANTLPEPYERGKSAACEDWRTGNKTDCPYQSEDSRAASWHQGYGYAERKLTIAADTPAVKESERMGLRAAEYDAANVGRVPTECPFPESEPTFAGWHRAYNEFNRDRQAMREAAERQKIEDAR